MGLPDLTITPQWITFGYFYFIPVPDVGPRRKDRTGSVNQMHLKKAYERKAEKGNRALYRIGEDIGQLLKWLS